MHVHEPKYRRAVAIAGKICVALEKQCFRLLNVTVLSLFRNSSGRVLVTESFTVLTCFERQ